MSGRRCAFIDIGTNTILCLIAEVQNGARHTVLDDLAEITRLGESVDQTRQISHAAEERSGAVLGRYLNVCKRLNVAEVIAVGTSALRDAENSRAVREQWRRQLGLNVRVISGDEEAAYTFLAVQHGLPVGGDELLVIDIGGGSTEFIRGNAAGIAGAVSTDLGSVRLTEKFLRSDPVTPAECAAMTGSIDVELAKLPARLPRVAKPLKLVGTAGTFTTLAAVEKRLARYAHSEVHGSRLTRMEVQRQIAMFQRKTLTERKTIVGLEPKRADVILAGACVAERIMSLYAASEMTVSDQGVRYGLLHERLAAFGC